jgi:hypothetical protein
VEADLRGPESRAEVHLSQAVAPSGAGGGLFSSLSRQSREALAQARKKAKKPSKRVFFGLERLTEIQCFNRGKGPVLFDNWFCCRYTE